MKMSKKIMAMCVVAALAMGAMGTTYGMTEEVITTNAATRAVSDLGTFWNANKDRQEVSFYYETGIGYPRMTLDIYSHPAYATQYSQKVGEYYKGEHVYYDRVYVVKNYLSDGSHYSTDYMISWVSYGGYRRYMKSYTVWTHGLDDVKSQRWVDCE
ncbi:MAG: hypothetical protein ACRCTE_07260 [Cellulosilyticaceae bacterium]